MSADQGIISLPDDGPAIDVPPFSGSWTAYFNRAVACGDLYREAELYSGRPLRLGGRESYVRAQGCGARDWSAKSTFWYPRPGRQFEITCNACKRMFCVEVRTAESASGDEVQTATKGE